MTNQEIDYGREEESFYLISLMALFPLPFEQGALHFHLALGPTHDVTGSSPCTGVPRVWMNHSEQI